MKVVIIGGIAGGMSVAFKAMRENPDLDITLTSSPPIIMRGDSFTKFTRLPTN